MVYNIGDKGLLFKYISLNLKNLYMSSLKVSDTYTIELAKCIYSFLSEIYPQQIFEVGGKTILSDDLSRIYLFGDGENKNYGCKIHPKQDFNQGVSDTNIYLTVYDTSVNITPESVDDINKYNISSWYLTDSIIQYLQPGTVISALNNEDDIAQAQYLFNSDLYTPETVGDFDDNLAYTCYIIQNSLKQQNSNLIASGYFDIYVESYLRGLNEVKF